MRLTLVPRGALFLAGVNALSSLVFALAPGLPLGPRFTGLICFLSAAVLFSLVVVRRWGHLTVGDTIAYRRLDVRLELPTRDAVAVRIQRPPIPLRRPTTYVLVVRVKGRDRLLPFAEHWLFGKRPAQDARALADRCGIPYEDPVGERWRASGNPLLRWLGRGEEWKLAVATAAMLAAAGLFALAA